MSIVVTIGSGGAEWWPPSPYLVAACIGVTGALVTVWLNIAHARRMKREERYHERQALRRALLQEMKIIREALADAAIKQKQMEDENNPVGFIQPTAPMDTFYDASSTRLGILTEREVELIMAAYLRHKSIKPNTLLLGGEPRTEHDNFVPKEAALSVLRYVATIMPYFDEAIAAIESAHQTDRD